MIAIRCDSSTQMGTGHLIRCLALAEQLREFHPEIHFFCRDLPGHISERAREKGFALTLIAANTSVAEEIKTIQNLSPQAVVVDHYDLDEKWESSFYSKSFVFVIDDLADRKHQCHALVDQNFRFSKENLYSSLLPLDTSLFLGSRFAILRKELLSLKRKNSAAGARKKILCFFGGADSSGEALKLAQALSHYPTDSFFQIVV
ncbi:MAG: UDP-2,4-diacetamido-2,4,6-trideoxy-beta-L-altropyranose hydrolase, partial [Pseudobdellovibrionaceae bacterium]